MKWKGKTEDRRKATEALIEGLLRLSYRGFCYNGSRHHALSFQEGGIDSVFSESSLGVCGSSEMRFA